MNIVTISSNHFYIFANDESSSYPDGRLDGFYRLMSVSKKDFKELKEAALDEDREKGSSLIKKFHEKNPDKNPNATSMSGDLREMNYQKIFESYVKAKLSLNNQNLYITN